MNHPQAALFERFLRERTFLKNVTPRTLVWYRVAFKNYSTACPDEALPSRGSLQQFVIGLRERHIKPVTCNTYIAAMNAYCRWLHEEGHATAAVRLQKLRVEKRVLELLDETQMRALIGYRPKTYRETRLHAAVLLVMDTGLRISEALGLRERDIDSDNLILKVFGKGQKERLVPFSPELRKRLYQLQQLKVKEGIRSELVFAGFHDAKWEKRNSTMSLHLPGRRWYHGLHGLASFLGRRT